MTRSVGVHEAKTHLSQLLVAVAAGEEVLITSRGRGVARLVPVAPARQLGVDVGRGWVSDDFDAPLPADLQASFES